MPPLATSVVDADAAAALRELDRRACPPRRESAWPGPRTALVVKAGADVAVEAEVVPGAGAVGGVEFFRGGRSNRGGDRPPLPDGLEGRGGGELRADGPRPRRPGGVGRVGRGDGHRRSSRTRAGTEEPGRVDLGDLPWSEATSGWGPVEKDRSNGEQGPGDGQTIRLNGRRHAKGLGVHAGLGRPLPAQGPSTRRSWPRSASTTRSATPAPWSSRSGRTGPSSSTAA